MLFGCLSKIWHYAYAGDFCLITDAAATDVLEQNPSIVYSMVGLFLVYAEGYSKTYRWRTDVFPLFSREQLISLLKKKSLQPMCEGFQRSLLLQTFLS
jgi:hypothetical protein